MRLIFTMQGGDWPGPETVPDESGILDELKDVLRLHTAYHLGQEPKTARHLGLG